MGAHTVALNRSGPGPTESAESAAVRVALPYPRKIVRCQKCNKFVTEIVITSTRPPVGPLVTLKNLKCPACGYVANVDLGVGEKDDPEFSAAVEQQLRKLNETKV